MWRSRRDTGRGGFFTPPPSSSSSSIRYPDFIPQSAPSTDNTFHVIHKVPSGNSPYVKAKHVQLIDRDPGKAIPLFWKAINSGDRADSALKDMAIVMKQLDRSDEAIEAIKSFRHLCPHESQEPLDNILLELYKRSGRIEDQIKMLQIKVKSIELGNDFGGKRIKPARSQGKKIYVTIEQEYSRLLGNLAWAYMQNNDFKLAEEHYRKALSLEPDKNKQCNLAICLMNMNRVAEAKLLLHKIRSPTYENGVLVEEESYAKSLERATDVLTLLQSTFSTRHPCPSPDGVSRGILSPLVLQTQPKRCSGSICGGDQRSFLRDNGRCVRKLGFEETVEGLALRGVKNGENVEKDTEDYFSTPSSKKSWADMVDEEEKPPFLFQTQRREEFKNENLDSNIMVVAPINLNSVPSLVNFVDGEKVDESFDCGNGIKMLKSSSKRLQVFKNITGSTKS